MFFTFLFNVDPFSQRRVEGTRFKQIQRIIIFGYENSAHKKGYELLYVVASRLNILTRSTRTFDWSYSLKVFDIVLLKYGICILISKFCCCFCWIFSVSQWNCLTVCNNIQELPSCFKSFVSYCTQQFYSQQLSLCRTHTYTQANKI